MYEVNCQGSDSGWSERQGLEWVGEREGVGYVIYRARMRRAKKRNVICYSGWLVRVWYGLDNWLVHQSFLSYSECMLE